MEAEKHKRESELFALLRSDKITNPKGFTKKEVNELFNLVISDDDVLNGASRLVACPAHRILTKKQFNALFNKVAKANDSKAAVLFLLETQSELTPAQIKKLFAVAKNDPNEITRLSYYARREEIRDLLPLE